MKKYIKKIFSCSLNRRIINYKFLSSYSALPVYKRCGYFAWKRNIRKCGFWFVDIPRTGSSSMRVALSDRYGFLYGKYNKDVLHSLNAQEYQVQRKGIPCHVTAQQMRAFVGKSYWEQLFTFSFVRNPWSRFVSYFEYHNKFRPIKDPLYVPMSFQEYIYKLQKKDFSFPPTYLPMLSFLQDESKNIIVDFVGRFENREHDLAVVADRLGIEKLSTPHIVSSSKPNRHYSAYYNKETKDIIEELYAEDIEYFGYSFEGKV